MFGETDEDKNDGNTRIVLPWAVIASLLSLLISGFAYSLGDAYYSSYLREFSIHHGAFPADHQTHFVLAFWGLSNALGFAYEWIGEHSSPLLCMIAAMLVLPISGWLALKRQQRARGKPREIPLEHTKKESSYTERCSLLGAVAIVSVMILSLCSFLCSAFGLSFYVGEAAGRNVALADKQKFDKGCEHSEIRCYRVVKDGVEVARGFVVAQSSDRVALYYMGDTSSVPLSDAIMQTLDTAPSISVKS
ncbi:hypothetical protein A8H39_22355 [Paraburkholderia fungorum]|jgi:hypothetical protein|uniref:hypothetical protein n=1 Tax=Paraburkholderia fungorum TaxID=134537 RepID=UPI0004819374|nr:hypothetical protein [Paraburkholderia fungorum]MBB5544185.1 hypothetical protein [Paraburkholderia fungorum]PNE58317.1 hypothetical protein A8H39_22355 [Paraburkholderia fungorum]